MSNIDKQALRNLAVAAKLAPSWYAVGEFGDVVVPAKPEWKPVHEFCKTFTAARVLALLDELEAAEKKTVEMPTFDGYVPHVARELQAAFRIACDNAGINVAAAAKGE
ncbi:ead/Ea22-like family protein [Enterobacter hormaechei]|uniref:ead/Ea22-like family protein n=1 Tax=Enterobacter hormaechei TaxID=158836 RepID=UPI0002FC589A|nr:ead/Ea22-like family protein [Enterobacter hormaechei]EKV8998517.1 ead/Ea22-like family protein [Enterobacter hormaechei]